MGVGGGGWLVFANIKDWQSQSILRLWGWGCFGLVQLEHLGMVEDLAGEIPFPELHQLRWTRQTAYMGKVDSSW